MILTAWVILDKREKMRVKDESVFALVERCMWGWNTE
jgi:hypothetical protein